MQEKNITEILPHLSPICSSKMLEVRTQAGLGREECYPDWSYEAVRLVETGNTHPNMTMIETLAATTKWNPDQYLRDGLHTSLKIKPEYIQAAIRLYLSLPRRNQKNVLRLLADHKFHSMGDYGRVFASDREMQTDPLACWFLTYCVTH